MEIKEAETLGGRDTNRKKESQEKEKILLAVNGI